MRHKDTFKKCHGYDVNMTEVITGFSLRVDLLGDTYVTKEAHMNDN